MKSSAEIVIIGAGPGGLSSAKTLAGHGMEVLVLERKNIVGPKVCAGGITWSGLLRVLPEELIEGAFSQQYIFSNFQHIRVEEPNPIVATVNRETLGCWMAQAAQDAGAVIEKGTTVFHVSADHIVVRDREGSTRKIYFKHLIGADGSSSIVRKSLGIPRDNLGIGLNYQIRGRYERMEWHLNTKQFGYGYGWIFPHRDTVSIGGFCDRRNLTAADLKKRVISWAAGRGFDLCHEQTRAALVNCDFRGFSFGNIWLVGDAAGLASGLTGEGIYPAIVSGKTVAKKIIDPAYPATAIHSMVLQQKRHHRVINLAAKHQLLCTFLMEWLVLLLRCKILDFQALEMAN